MQSAIDVFRSSIGRLRQLGGLHQAISALTTHALDPSDLLRAQIVMAVSALDYFVHEITVLGMIEIVQGKRPATDAFSKQKVSGSLLVSPAVGSLAHFEEDARTRHSYLSFQQPDKIADAIRLFYPGQIWKEVALNIGTNEQQLKTGLKLIVDRRNKIAHEADADPSYPGAVWPITPADAQHAVDFIERLCEEIHIKVKI